MRVLAIRPGPHYSVADVHNGVVSGLRANGVTVADLNLDDRLDFYVSAQLEINGQVRKAFEYEAAVTMASKSMLAAVYEYWPDVVIVMSGFFIHPDTFRLLRSRGHHVVLWCTESPYEDDRQLNMAHAADTVILNDPKNIDDFRGINPRTFYIPHGYDPLIHRPGAVKPEWACDFGFVGTGYPSRVEFFEKVDWSGITALFAGNWQQVDEQSPLAPFLAHERGQCIDNTDTAVLYQSCKVSANLDRKEAQSDDLVEGLAMGPREVELAACGTWFARESRLEGDDVLWMLPQFTEPAELGDIIRWGLDNAEQVGQAVRLAKEAVADRTFQQTTARLLKIIGA
jgi:spore maturation protein CgeB